MRGFPIALVLSRGHFCPKDRRQMQNYVYYLQPELRVNYCKLVTVSVDDPVLTTEVRDQLDADWPFLCDADRKLLHELEMVDHSDDIHGEIYIPYTFLLDRDRVIYKIYNSWWFVAVPRSRKFAWTFATCSAASRIGSTQTPNNRRAQSSPRLLTPHMQDISPHHHHAWTAWHCTDSANVDGLMRRMVLSHPLDKKAGNGPNFQRRTPK